MTDALQVLWARITATVLVSPHVVLGAAVLVLAALAFRRPWHLTRHLLTIAHEASHATVAVLAGRRLSGIKVHSDTSGLTVSVGNPRGPGMVAVAFAGYTGPAVLGLGAAWAISAGHAPLVLWALLAILVLVLPQVRNWYGLVVILVAGAVVWALSWYTSAGPAACVAAWVLLLGSPRTVVELMRAPRGSRDSDALAGLTGVPATVWAGVMMLVTAGALAAGVWLMVLQ